MDRNLATALGFGLATVLFGLASFDIPVIVWLVPFCALVAIVSGARSVSYKQCRACRKDVPRRAKTCPLCDAAVSA